MKTEWKEEIISRTPLEFEKVNEDTWIQRKDVKKIPVGEDGFDFGYRCMSRFISENVKETIDVTNEIIEKIYNSQEYKTGYEAATILFGGSMSSEPIIRASELRPTIETSVQYLTDEESINVPELFPSWEINHVYRIDDKVSRDQILYKCIQEHISKAELLPENTPNIWSEMN